MKHAFAFAALMLAPGVCHAAEAGPIVPAPSEIVAAAPRADWVGIAPADLLVMDLAPDARNKLRRVVIQLMPAPFSQGWIGNIRKLALAHWWDGTSVNRVQDNYVVQWGDAGGDDKAKARALPPELEAVDQSHYEINATEAEQRSQTSFLGVDEHGVQTESFEFDGPHLVKLEELGAYGMAGLWNGWQVGEKIRGKGRRQIRKLWPVHCYGMVGVGRNLPPDTGTGAELYAVIGTPPRHLDRNIAVVGRVIEGIEHLSSLPRGTGALGFYETAAQRVPIVSVRLGSEVPGLAAYEYLSTESDSFARYADARANRRDAFFVRPAGGADICNIPVPVRRVQVSQ